MSEATAFRCPALFEGLRRLATELAPRLNAAYPDGPPLRRGHRLSPGTAEEITVPYWEPFILVNAPQIIDCDAYRAIVAAVEGDTTISEHVRRGCSTPLGGGPIATEDWVPGFLCEAFDRQSRAEVIEDRLVTLYRDLEDAFYSNAVPIRGLGPLHGLDLPCEQMTIGDGVSLVRLSEEQRNDFFTEWGQHASRLGTFRGMETTALQVDLTIPKVLGQDIPHAAVHPHTVIEQRMRRAISALRLLERGGVGLNTIRVRPLRWNPFVGGGGPGGILNDWVMGLCHLHESDAPRLRETYMLLMKAENEKRARLLNAVRRFNLTQERADLTDRLVDCVVGLEALYLADRGSELRYRLSLRTAVHLGKTPEERWRIFYLVQAAYDERSSEIHGDRAETEQITVGGRAISLRDFVEEACEVLRGAIADAITVPKNDHKQWLRGLDEALLDATVQRRFGGG